MMLNDAARRLEGSGPFSHSPQPSILWDVRRDVFRTYVGFHVSIEEIQSLVALVTESITQVKTQPHFSSLWSPPDPHFNVGGRSLDSDLAEGACDRN